MTPGINRGLRLAMGALLVMMPTASARATCGAANCFLVTGTEQGIGLKGRLAVDVSFRYILQDQKLSGSREVDEVLTPKVDFENGVLEPDHHREIRTQNTLVEIDMAYGLTDRLTLAWVLPIINDRDHEHFDEVGTAEEHFTRADGSAGFGDLRVGIRSGLLVRGRDLMVGGLFLKLPTGAYRLRDSEGEINEPTIQPGTGSTDVIGTLHYARQIVPLQAEWFVSGAYHFNRENDLDYCFGDQVEANAGFRYRTRGDVTWSLQVNGRRAGRDRFRGAAVPSTGSTLVNLTPGVKLERSPATSIYGFVQIPVHQEVNETNLAPRLGLVIGVSKVF